MIITLAQRVTAELVGTAALLAAIVGSGILATELATDLGVALLINVLSIILALGILIASLGPVSGAHFNPVVTLVAAVRREMNAGEAGLYVVAQVGGALLGVAVANIMYGLPAWTASTTQRSGFGLLLGEVIATGGLLFVIGALTRTNRGHLGPLMVPAWIGAAAFFTSSTSFANPAVTIGRAFSDTFTGIAPDSVLPFIVAQVIGAAAGAALTELWYPRIHTKPEPLDLPVAVHHRGD